MIVTFEAIKNVLLAALKYTLLPLKTLWLNNEKTVMSRNIALLFDIISI